MNTGLGEKTHLFKGHVGGNVAEIKQDSAPFVRLAVTFLVDGAGSVSGVTLHYCEVVAEAVTLILPEDLKVHPRSACFSVKLS